MKGLRELRSAAGLTQQRLARRARMDRGRIIMAETGQLQLSPLEQNRLRRILLAAIRRRVGAIQKILAEPDEAQPVSAGAGS